MKHYDFEKVKNFIQQNKDNLKSVSLGMHEDWFWTAESVFENGEFLKMLNESTEIVGINGSYWATPVMQVEFVDGSEKTYKCFKGESDGINPILYLGILSSPIQESRISIELEEI